MFIQFDAEIDSEEQLLADLRAAGIPARSVRASRWVRTDPLTREQSDAGGRVDIELMYETRSQAELRVTALTAFMRSRLG